MTRNLRYLRGVAFCWTAMLCLITTISSAQPGWSPGSLFDSVIDRTGHKYHLQKLTLNDTTRAGDDSIWVNTVSTCSSGYYQLYLEPGSGMEDNGDPTHMARRNVLCKVLSDLSQFIHSPLNANGKKINVWVRTRTHVPGFSGLAYGTSIYAVPTSGTVSGVADNVTWSTIQSGVDGYTNLSNITSVITSSSAPFFHIIIAFDFDSYAWNTSLTTAPSSSEYDLYTVALREVTHALGFSSLISSDGTSVLGSSRDVYGRYDAKLKTHSGTSLLDHSGSYAMYDYSFNSALNASNILSPYPLSCVTDSTKCDTALQYAGSVTEPVYTPNCFELGFSLGCFEDECHGTPSPANDNAYFVESNATNLGSLKRYLKPEERSVLCDIGYSVDSSYGDTTNLSFYHYGSSVCSGAQVVGVNDGLSSQGNHIYFSSIDGTVQINGSGLPSGVPGLLANDINADEFEGLQVVNGSGSLSATSGTSTTNVIYTPGSNENVIVVRYTPVNSTLGERGNITYAYMLVSHDLACSPTSCNLIVNGDFATHLYHGVIDNALYNVNSCMQGTKVCNWHNYVNTCDLYSTTSTAPCLTNYIYNQTAFFPTIPPPLTASGSLIILDPSGGTTNNFVGILSGRRQTGMCPSGGGISYFSEALQTQLSAPLIYGVKYILEFDARVGREVAGSIITLQEPTWFQFYVSDVPPLFDYYPGCSADISQQNRWPATWEASGCDLTPLDPTMSGGYRIDTAGWRHIRHEFTYTGPAALAPDAAQFLIVMNNPKLTLDSLSLLGYNVSGEKLHYVYTTNYKITPIIQTYPPQYVCPGTPFNLYPDSIIIDPTAGGTSPADTFAWTPGGSGLSCYVCPNPTGAISSTTVYTVTESLYQCKRYDTINVFPPVNAVASGTTPICSTDTLKLFGSTSTGTAPLTYSWAEIIGGVPTPLSTSANVTIPPPHGPYSSPTIRTFRLIVTDSNGCKDTAFQSIEIDPMPGAIAGPHSVCVGSSIALTDPVSGGHWFTVDPTVIVGYTDGVVMGISPGTAVIYYGFGLSCMVRDTITVNDTPSISGSHSVCVGSTISLTVSLSGGTWSYGSGVSVSFSGVTALVTGVTAGPSLLTYTLGTGCSKTYVINVLPLPDTITGTRVLCEQSTTTLHDATPGGTWSSSNTAVATVGVSTGVVTGVSGGTSVITYMLSTGCYVTAVVTVNPLPAAITGTDSVCVGSTTTLSDATYGGTWSSSDGSIATVDPSTGVVTGVGAGTVVIRYALSTGCYRTVIVTVNPLPGPIAGTAFVCVGFTTTLSDLPSGGTWSSSDITIATVGVSTGVVTGVSAGIIRITYTLSTGCYRAVKFTVYKNPDPISGLDTICKGDKTTYTDATPDGTWSSSDPSVATVSSTGGVTGVNVGTAIITYTTAGGCIATKVITVISIPVVDPIAGLDSVCISSTITLTDPTAGGTWSSSDPTIATVSSSGVVTGVSTEMVTITYTVRNKCGTTRVTKKVKVVTTPVISDITGITSVCSGFTTTLADAFTGGTWSSSNTAVATVDPSTGVVTGIATGTAHITYIFTSACGSDTATTDVIVNGLPYITTNFLVACQSLSSLPGDGETPGHGPVIISGDTSCILVCDSTIVRYYANGVAGSAFTWGPFVGGVVVSSYPTADSIDVLWPFPGTMGYISLFDTFEHCIGEASACIRVIPRPHADFSAGSYSICLGDNVVFTDHSTGTTGSDIVSWYWTFGDGSSASVVGPLTHTFASEGDFWVTLVVTNECGCVDTARVMIHVDHNPGPHIYCPSVACENEYAIYHTDDVDPCGYHWSVIGGTIVSGAGTDSITVHWDAIGSDGFGSVSLSIDCGLCTDTTTIRVPVILQSPVIAGPSVVCAGKEYEFSFPLWAATQYMWGVLGEDSSIMHGGRRDHKVVITFPSAGTYTVHGWYQNRLKLCGANVDKVVTVMPPTRILGVRTVCRYSTETYSLAGGLGASSWNLVGMDGSSVAMGVGATFTYTFDATGVYFLYADGAFCADPITIRVIDVPPAIDSVIGEDTICLHRVYTYKAYNDVPGAVYEWEAVGGTVLPASGSSEVAVTWTDSGPKMLIVSHTSMTPPYCPGKKDTFHITQEVINPIVTGPTTPCANSLRSYATAYDRAEVYEWSIYPTTAGSVVTGNYTQGVDVLWNNVAGTVPVAANVILKVTKCDSIVFDTLAVSVLPDPGVVIAASDSPACPQTMVTFTATAGGISYLWDFGDGTSGVGASVGHSFPVNTTSGNILYLVTVTVLPDAGATCPVSGTGTYLMSIRPGPVAHASCAGSPYFCPPTSRLIVGTITSSIGALTYQWFDGTSPIGGATGTTYLTISTGNFSFVVIDSNGCTDTSNIMHFIENCTDTTTGTTTDTTTSPCGFTGTANDICTFITLSETGSTSTPLWHALTPPINPAWGGGSVLAGTPVIAEYDTPGIYRFILGGSVGGCIDSITVVDTVGIVAKYRYRLRCATSGYDSVYLYDYSTRLPWWNITSITWTDLTTGAPIATGAQSSVVLPAPGTYTILETVSGTRPGGTFSCTYTLTFALPGPPLASFNFAGDSVCSGIPTAFTYTGSGGISHYNWDFNDGSSILLTNPHRTFTWPGGGNPFNFHVKLTITDSIGCTDDTIRDVHVYRNLLNGSLGLDETVCSNAVPVTLLFSSTGPSTPVLLTWSTGDITVPPSYSIDVSLSGAYWVQVDDIRQCRITTFPAKNVKIIHTPTAIIRGRQDYCLDDVVQLTGFVGSKINYEWYRDGALISHDPYIADGGLGAGAYVYQLIVSVSDTNAFGTVTTCSDTSDTDTVRIHLKPPVPSISGPTVVDCPSYHLQLTATEPLTGTFNWSNWTSGLPSVMSTSSVDDIYAGGPYRVTFTDRNGCTNFVDFDVPYSVDKWWPYFPSGCYEICSQQLPITLYGPLGITFPEWKWLNGVTPVLYDVNSVMAPYTITGPGNYSWYLDNGLCAGTSDPMSLDTINCACLQAFINAEITCNPDSPACYNVHIDYTGIAGTYVLGTDIGPMYPFSGTFGGGTIGWDLMFTTLYFSPLPDSITIMVQMTYDDGTKCFAKVRVALPTCSWILERAGHSPDSTVKNDKSTALINNALLVYPNPASEELTLQYVFGAPGEHTRTLAIYDALGRRVGYKAIDNGRGSWKVNTKDWSPGVYIIRMEEDGTAISSQRAVILSH